MISSVRIVGAGLIGTSIGLRLKSLGISVEILDVNAQAMKLAGDLIKSEPIKAPDLIIIAVPIASNLSEILKQLKENPDSKVCDLASVKSDLVLQVKELSDNCKNFFSLHPMAGREVNGAENARADLFEGRAWIGIEDSYFDKKNNEIAETLVELCGGSIYWLSTNEHDRVVATISHLPQILSSLLAGQLNTIESKNLNLAGQGLRDLTRLANADSALWSQILIANSAAISHSLERLIKDLSELKENLDLKDINNTSLFLNNGKSGKEKIPGKHGAIKRDYAFLPIVIDDKPGELARIFNECASISVNIEDLTIEHSPGQETGLITLALSISDCLKLTSHLDNLGFKVHPAKNR